MFLCELFKFSLTQQHTWSSYFIYACLLKDICIIQTNSKIIVVESQKSPYLHYWGYYEVIIIFI